MPRPSRLLSIVSVLVVLLSSALVASPAQAGTASISGRVIDPYGSNVVGGAVVDLFAYNGTAWEQVAVTTSSSADDETYGSYDFGGLAAGTYRVCVESRTDGLIWDAYKGRCWKGAASVATATDLVVADGSTTTGIGIRVKLFAGVIKGFVGDLGGTPVEGVPVDVFQLLDGAWVPVQGNFTGVDGSYQATRVPPGTYRVCFNYVDADYVVPGLSRSCWKNAAKVDTGTDITLGVDRTVSGISGRLGPAGQISGTVTGLGPRAFIPVTVYDESGDVVGSDWVGLGDSTFSVGALATGSYRVSFNRASNSTQYEATYYNGKHEWEGLPAGDLVSVTAGSPTALADVSLGTGGTISGYTKTAGGVGVANCLVVALTDDGRLVTRSAASGSTGKFLIRGVTTGTYKLAIAPWSCGAASSEVDRWFDTGSPGHLSTDTAAADGVPAKVGTERSVGTLVVGP